MATIVNDRDKLLQAESQRVIAGSGTQNTAIVFIYQRSNSSTPPALPNAACVYTFSTAGLTGLNNGWLRTLPASNEKYLYAAMVTVTGTAASVTIPAPPASGSWGAASLLAANGADGINGTNGANGSNGSNGARGSVTASYTNYPYNYWMDNFANQALYNLGYYERIVGDVVTLAASSNYAETRFWSGSSWVVLNAYISGNMLVSGTFAADKIAAGSTLSGVAISGGSITIAGNNFRVYSDGSTIAANLTSSNASFNNTANPASAAITANSPISFATSDAITALCSSSGYALKATGGASREAIFGYNSSGTSPAHGVRGQSRAYASWTPPSGISGGGSTPVTTSTITSGLVGCASGYDFYADGGGTNYGPFTGAHDVLWPNELEVSVGDIVIDVECVARSGLSNTIFSISPSSIPYQKAAVGVLVLCSGKLADHVPAAFMQSRTVVTSDAGPSYETTVEDVISPCYEVVKNLYLRGAANALGEGQINVCGESGDIEAGDLIVTSSMRGKGMRQSDDVVRSYTVARAREACVFSTASEVKTIACIYLCG